MSSSHLKNIPLKLFRSFLVDQGCVCNRKNGGHEHWTRKNLLRPITIQSHVDPVPEFIVRTILKQLGLRKEDFTSWI